MDLLSFLRNIQLVWASHGLGWEKVKKAWALAWLYGKLDRETKRFRQQAKMGCFKGCGKCCENVYVEASLVEVIPLAAVLWRRKKRDLWIKKLAEQPLQGQCIFYERTSGQAGKGKCRIYPLRPLICRLFGFAGRLNKYGGQQWLTCHLMKIHHGLKFVDISRRINQDLNIPSIRFYRSRIQSLSSLNEVEADHFPKVLQRAISIVNRYLK